MKRAVLTLFFLPCLICAQEPLDSTKTSTLEAKLAATSKKYNIQCLFPKAEDPKTRDSHTYAPVTTKNDKNAAALVDMFVEEFNKYPVDFIRASRLKRVLFVEDLAVQGQRRAAVPDYDNEDLLYDPAYAYNARYMRHVIHHEFYHMLEQEWNG